VEGAAISLRGLRKVYRRTGKPDIAAVDGLDLEIPYGGVYGFLGPNGAGKTTTIRCLLGLVAPTEGQVEVLGHDVTTDLVGVIDRIGALVESPKFFPSVSGRKNLELLASLRGVSFEKIGQALEKVGLGERASDAFGVYSLGMKQRLAVAAALIKDPDLLILDEPANGLDPAGIREMRELIRSLGNTGATVFVSSHQLAEIEQMCDAVAIIDRGRLRTMGKVGDVLDGRGSRLVVTIEDAPGAAQVLVEAGFEARVDSDEVVIEIAPDRAADVTRALAVAGRYLSGLRAARLDLETVFLELTGGEDRE